MSSNLRCSYITGLTLWAACREDDGDVLDVAGGSGTFEAWGTAADYDITATEDNSMYIFDMADFTGLAAGRYDIQVFVRAGATAANTDVLVRVFTNVLWDGSDIIYEVNTSGQVSLLTATQASVDAIETDTNEIQGKLPANKFMGSSDGADDDTTLNSVGVIVAAIDTLTQANGDGDLAAIKAGTVTNAQGADVATDVALLVGTDGKALISTDAQDMSGTLDVNTKTIAANAITATAINADAITNAKIADNAIAVENIKDAAITADKIADDAITSAKYDETTAFPVKSADTGSTEIARTGADGDTLEDLSDEIAGIATAAGQPALGD